VTEKSLVKKPAFLLALMMFAALIFGGCATSSENTKAVPTGLTKKYLSQAISELEGYPRVVFKLNFRGSKLGAATQLLNKLGVVASVNDVELRASGNLPKSLPEKFDSYTLQDNGMTLCTLLYVDTGEVLVRVNEHNVITFLNDNPSSYDTYLKYAVPLLGNDWYKISASQLIRNAESTFSYLPLPTKILSTASTAAPGGLPDPLLALVEMLSRLGVSGAFSASGNPLQKNGSLTVNSVLAWDTLLQETSHLFDRYGLSAPFGNYVNNLINSLPPVDLNSAIFLETDAGGTYRNSLPKVTLSQIQESLTSGLMKLEFNVTVSNHKTRIVFPTHPKKISAPRLTSLRLMIFSLLQHYFS
jgi:hypothetical protein